MAYGYEEYSDYIHETYNEYKEDEKVRRASMSIPIRISVVRVINGNPLSGLNLLRRYQLSASSYISSTGSEHRRSYEAPRTGIRRKLRIICTVSVI